MSGRRRAGLGPLTLLRWIGRDFRGARGRLLFFLLCLSVGVAAVVGVKSFSASLDSGLRERARELIAGDIEVSSRRALGERPVELWQRLRDDLGLEVVEVRELFSVASSQRDLVSGAIPGLSAVGSSQVVEVKAVSPGYPLYGTAEVEPEGGLARLAEQPFAALLAPELLDRLSLDLGDAVLLGGRPFEVVGVIRSEPDRLSAALSIGPRVMVSYESLERTGLVTEVSRASYEALLGVPDGLEVESVVATLERELPRGEFEIETFRDARPELRQALSQLAGFLGLVALLSLLVGGVGIAQTVRAWMATAWDQMAIQKSLGVRPRELFALYTVQAVLLALAGSALGALLGGLLQLLVPRLWPALIPTDLLDPWQPWPIGQGFLLGVVVALAFSLPSLLVVLRVPAARVLRRDTEPLRSRRRTTVLLTVALVAVVFVVAWVQAADLRVEPALVAGGFTGVLLLTVGALWLAARGLVALVSRSRRSGHGRGGAGVAWRYGVSALARPGSATLSAVVALGLGILVVLSMLLVEGALTRQLRGDLPRDAPSMFLLGIREAQWAELRPVLEGSALPASLEPATEEWIVESVPVIMTRVLSVDGESFEERLEQADEDAAAGDEASRWATRRQLRVTTLGELPEDNRVVEGAWFQDDGIAEASFERDFAESFGVDVGSVVELQVGDEVREITVSNLREVDWEGFGINFFVVVEPGTFAPESTFRLATVRLPREREQELQDLVAAGFPGVTVIRVSAALEKVTEILTRVGWGIRFLGLFTVVSALVILAGSVAAGAAQRGREAALLKALGMTRRQVVLAFATEYALLGVVAATIAVIGAVASSWLAVDLILEIDWSFEPLPLLGATVLGVALAVLGGTAASFGAVRRRPIEALRTEG